MFMSTATIMEIVASSMTLEVHHVLVVRVIAKSAQIQQHVQFVVKAILTIVESVSVLSQIVVNALIYQIVRNAKMGIQSNLANVSRIALMEVVEVEVVEMIQARMVVRTIAMRMEQIVVRTALLIEKALLLLWRLVCRFYLLL